MTKNIKRFKTPASTDLERVFATHVGNDNTPATGEVLRLQQGWDSMGLPFYITMDGSIWIPSDEFEVGIKPTRVLLGSETLTLKDVPKGLKFVPMFAKSAELNITPYDDGVAWATSDLVDVNSKTFRHTSPGRVIRLRGGQEVRDFTAVSLAANGYSIGIKATLHVAYYNLDAKGNFTTYLDEDVVISFMFESDWQHDKNLYTFNDTACSIEKLGTTSLFDTTILSKMAWRVGDAPISLAFRTDDKSSNLGVVGITSNFVDSGNDLDQVNLGLFSTSELSSIPFENGGQAAASILGGVSRTKGLFEIRLDGTEASCWFSGVLKYTSPNPLQEGVDYVAQVSALDPGATYKDFKFPATNPFTL